MTTHGAWMSATQSERKALADADALRTYVAEAEAYAVTRAEQVTQPEYIRLH